VGFIGGCPILPGVWEGSGFSALFSGLRSLFAFYSVSGFDLKLVRCRRKTKRQRQRPTTKSDAGPKGWPESRPFPDTGMGRTPRATPRKRLGRKEGRKPRPFPKTGKSRAPKAKPRRKRGRKEGRKPRPFPKTGKSRAPNSRAAEKDRAPVHPIQEWRKRIGHPSGPPNPTSATSPLSTSPSR
jgi:hypothetical protein